MHEARLEGGRKEGEMVEESSLEGPTSEREREGAFFFFFFFFWRSSFSGLLWLTYQSVHWDISRREGGRNEKHQKKEVEKDEEVQRFERSLRRVWLISPHLSFFFRA